LFFVRWWLLILSGGAMLNCRIRAAPSHCSGDNAACNDLPATNFVEFAPSALAIKVDQALFVPHQLGESTRYRVVPKEQQPRKLSGQRTSWWEQNSGEWRFRLPKG
jgi:hypothetical protein